MSRTFLGLDARGRPLYLSDAVRRSTHSHIVGGSGTGKSKFLEWLIRQDVKNRQGLCLIDWHGTLYGDVLRWCHERDVGLAGLDDRRIILLNPSQPDFITGFNPFSRAGADISTQVSRRIDALIRPWGVTNTDTMPTLESVCRALFTFMAETGETLPNAAKLLDFRQRELRDYAVRACRDPRIAYLWQDLQQVKNAREWRERVLSTENRLTRFLGSKAVSRFMGLADGNLDLDEAMDAGAIVLVNLGYSDYLPRDAAGVFAALLLNEFFEAAMRRAGRAEPPRPFVLYLDEFQEYITDDIAAMLDQVRKGGLHLVLAHQHLGHFADNPRLEKSVVTNARIRTVFGGLDYHDACFFANEMFLPDLNTRQIKKAYYHTIHLYREESRSSETRGEAHSESHSVTESAGSGRSTSSLMSVGSGSSETLLPQIGPGGGVEGWFVGAEGASAFESAGSSESQSSFESESETFGESSTTMHSVTTGPVFVPIPVQELGSESEWSREEKVSKVAEILKCQQQRHCFVKMDHAKTQPLRVPDVRTRHVERETLEEYARMLYERQGSASAALIDQRLIESEERFLERVQRRAAPLPAEASREDDDGWH